MRSKVGAWSSRTDVFIRRDNRDAPTAIRPRGDTATESSRRRNWPCQHRALGYLASKTVRNKFLQFKPECVAVAARADSYSSHWFGDGEWHQPGWSQHFLRILPHGKSAFLWLKDWRKWVQCSLWLQFQHRGANWLQNVKQTCKENPS